MATSIAYTFVRSRQLEGTYPGDQALGIWGSTYYRVRFGWGDVDSSLWPEFDVLPYGRPEPANADTVAKQNRRLIMYQRVRSAADCSRVLQFNRVNGDSEALLQNCRVVRVAFGITERFLTYRKGVITIPSKSERVVGTHAVPLVLDDPVRSVFRLQNSWGPDWGRNGYALISYSYIDNYMVDGWFSREIHSSKNPEPLTRRARWTEPSPLGGQYTCYEINDPEQDERIAWCSVVERDGFLDVEELFVRPRYRRRGYGSELAQFLKDESRSKQTPLRCWIPYVDCGPANRAGLSGIMRGLGLKVDVSPRSWAAYVATPGLTPLVFPEVSIPPAPAYSLKASLIPIPEASAVDPPLDRPGVKASSSASLRPHANGLGRANHDCPETNGDHSDPDSRDSQVAIIPSGLEETIRGLARGPNWSVDGAEAIASESCETSIQFLRRLMSNLPDLGLPRVGPSVLGGVALTWDLGQVQFMVRVESGDMNLLYFQREGPGFQQEDGYATFEEVIKKLDDAYLVATH